jgi:hypothetical protein
MLTTTCFGRCRPSSGHKLYHKGKLYRLKVLDVLQIHSFRDLVVYRFIHIEYLKIDARFDYYLKAIVFAEVCDSILDDKSLRGTFRI